MTAFDIETTNLRSDATAGAAPPAERFGKALLLVNGTLLGTVALVAAMSDLAGALLNLGPMAHSLYGNPQAIGPFEAHGLALILAILMLTNSRAGGASWNGVGALVHLLLGASNLMFWPIFSQGGLVPLGIATTGMHVVFLVLEAAATLWRMVPNRRRPATRGAT